jgi:hypothetical protein
MRLPRFVLAGLLLFAAVFLLTALFAQSPYRWVGATATAIFLPLWLVITIVNAAIGVRSAGYRPVEEAAAAIPVFGLPAVAAGVTWWFSAYRWDGGPLVTSGRTPLILAAGIALWLTIALLTGLLSPDSPTAGAIRRAAAVFIPLWVALQIVNLLIGVAVGHPVLEEIPILLLNVAIPALVAVAAAYAGSRRQY